MNPVRPAPGGSSLAGHVRVPRPHRHARRAAAGVGALAGADRHVRRRGRAVRVRAGARPAVRGHRGLPAARRRHRRRPQGDVRLPRQGRPPHGAAARGHRLGGPGVRAAPTAHAVEGLVRHPGFRYERPQAGRLRQHHQVDVEVARRRRPRRRRRGHRARRHLPRRPRAAAVASGRQHDGHARRPRPRTPTRSRPGCGRRVGELAKDDQREGRVAPAAGARLEAPRDPGRGGRRAPHRRRPRRRVAAPTSSGSRPA